MVDELKSSTYAVMANQQNLSIIIKKSVMMSADELSMANWRLTQKLQKRKSKSCCGFVAVLTFQQPRKGLSSCSAGKEKESRFASSIHPDRSRKEQSSSSKRGWASVMTMVRDSWTWCWCRWPATTCGSSTPSGATQHAPSSASTPWHASAGCWHASAGCPP
jgi:hypothetical protein